MQVNFRYNLGSWLLRRTRWRHLPWADVIFSQAIIFVYASATSGQQMSESHDLRRRGRTAGATGGHFEERVLVDQCRYWFAWILYTPWENAMVPPAYNIFHTINTFTGLYTYRRMPWMHRYNILHTFTGLYTPIERYTHLYRAIHTYTAIYRAIHTYKEIYTPLQS